MIRALVAACWRRLTDMVMEHHHGEVVWFDRRNPCFVFMTVQWRPSWALRLFGAQPRRVHYQRVPMYGTNHWWVVGAHTEGRAWEETLDICWPYVERRLDLLLKQKEETSVAVPED